MSERSRKERLAIPRQEMPEQEAAERRWNFDEVNLGFTSRLAILEAERCLNCPHPKCVDGCPVGVRIDDFVTKVAAGDFAAAAEVIAEDNTLPAVCGRVCPQENQCEGACVLAPKRRPVAIGHLERFVADWERDHRLQPRAPAPPTGKRVAVVGSGPAGLACAGDLAKAGHAVTVFEALHTLGGVLAYGIPEFRLPKEILAAEIEGMRDLGVTFETNTPIGPAGSLDDLMGEEGFYAVFLGVGAGLPRFLDVPGENLIGVITANEFLTRVNLMKAWAEDAETPVYDLLGREVAVFGSGNTAMDAARTALRLGGQVTLYYRRSEEEMPARAEEIHHARAEGVAIETLVAPVAMIDDGNGWLAGIRLQRMELGEPDNSGRRRPVPVPGSEFEVDAEVAIVAIGNRPNPLASRTAPDLELSDRGTVVVDAATGRTSKKGVFAGGDIVTGGATVILAMGAGRRAAAAINDLLTS